MKESKGMSKKEGERETDRGREMKIVRDKERESARSLEREDQEMMW